MSSTAAPGPEIDVKEDLYRCINSPHWWLEDQGRPSSAAFHFPDFSVDIASIAKTPQYTLRRFNPRAGVVHFNYGDAKQIGFVARKEDDPNYPDNLAHANVYNQGGNPSKRKSLARQLAEIIGEKKTIDIIPSF